MNNLNNTTIENNEILKYEEYCEMSQDDLLHQIEMNMLKTRLSIIEHDTSMFVFQREIDKLNRTLSKFGN